MNYAETIAARPIEPEYGQVMAIESLSAHELEVLQLIASGYKNSMIAQELYVSEGTTKTHVRNISRKPCVSDRTQAAIRAFRSGLVY